MQLSNKTFLLFAATGAISRGVATLAASHGAHVCLTGRDAAALTALENEILATGGSAESAVVDALDPAAIASCISDLAARRRIDAVFNGIGLRAAEAEYCTPSPQLPLEKFLLPIRVIAGSIFLTSREAAPVMAASGGGAIITLSASLSGSAVPFMAGITAACGAIEAMSRSLAGEFGPAGVRVNCVRPTALPETRTIQETNARYFNTLAGMGVPLPPENSSRQDGPLIGRALTVADAAAAVVFLASDAASGMTGQVLNVCGGQLLD